MTDPFDDPAGRWGLIFYGSGLRRRAHTRQEWAQIAHAIATADGLSTGTRGDAAWCQTAADTYVQLHDTGAYAHLRPDGSPRWHADEDLIRAWLNAPAVPAENEPATTLDAHGWRDTFDPARTPEPAELSLLAGLAQDAGVVGAPGYTVSLLRWVDERGSRDDAFLVLLWPPHGPARGSAPVALTDLLPPSASTVDRMVGVLRTVAARANDLLTSPAVGGGPASDRARAEHTTPPTSVEGYPIGTRGRAFRLINGGAGSGPSAPPPSTPLPPRRPRT